MQANSRENSKSQESLQEIGSRESRQSHRQRYQSIYSVIFSGGFLGATMFSLTLPSMPLYLKSLEMRDSTTPGFAASPDPKSSQFLGLVFAAFSIGQLIASPVAGWLFNRTTARLPMICSAVIMLIANLLYALAQNSWQLLISRFLVGLGAGNATVARAYIGKCCTPENGELTKMMALLSASQAVGFIIGPLFGLLFVDISWNVIEVAGQPDQPHWKVVVDKNTFPGYFAAILTLVSILPFIINYREFNRPDLEANQSTAPSIPETSPPVDTSDQSLPTKQQPIINNQTDEIEDDWFSVNEESPLMESHDTTFSSRSMYEDAQQPAIESSSINSNNPDWIAVWIMNVLFFIIVLGFAVFETILVYFTSENYSWDVRENGYLFAGSSVITVVSLLLLKPLQTLAKRRRPVNSQKLSFWEDDRAYMLIGMAGMGAANFCTMNFFPDHPLPLFLFLMAGLMFFSPSFPIAQSTCFILFSKILGPGEHGVALGIQTAIGCFARIIGPITGTALYDLEDARPNPTRQDSTFHTGQYLWPTTGSIMMTGVLVVIVGWSRLVPFAVYQQRKRALTQPI